MPWARSTLAGVAAAITACSSAPAATIEFFGPTIEPPRGLAQIQPGISVAEAMKRVPALREDLGGVRDKLVLDSGVRDVRLEVRIEAGLVSSLVAIVGPNARMLMTRAWGEPQVTRDSLGQPELSWASEVTGWRVKLDCLERNCLVEYMPYHALTAEYFGAHVTPPSDLAKLRVGMKVVEARKLAAGLVDVRAGLPTGVDGVRQYVAIDDKTSTVRGLYINIPAHATPVIEEAWGASLTATELGKSVRVWLDSTTGWRAILRPALGSSQDLAFEEYLPVAQMFGEQVDVLDAVPVLGIDVDELDALFAGQITQTGRDYVVSLPPTEWERSQTKVALDTQGGKVRELAFSITYKAHPPARDTLLELFTHKWGTPRPSEDDGQPILIFRDGLPRVEVREDTEHDAWKLVIRR